MPLERDTRALLIRLLRLLRAHKPPIPGTEFRPETPLKTKKISPLLPERVIDARSIQERHHFTLIGPDCPLIKYNLFISVGR